MPRGGAREGAGRKPGQKNKLTSDAKRTLSEMAAEFTEPALRTLSSIMLDEKAPHAARATAANSLLDRGHGKAKQPIEHELDIAKLTDEQAIALALALGADPAALAGLGGIGPSPLQH